MDYVSLGWTELLLSLLFIILTAAIVALERLGEFRSLAVGTVRAFVQLIAVGYLLEWIFAAEAWYWTLLTLAIMTGIAAASAYGRQKRRPRGLLLILLTGIVAGTALTLAPTLLIILKLDNTFHPQYAIPIGSMILAPALNAASMAADRMLADVKLRRVEIETLLTLGADRRQALQASGSEALRAGLISYMNKLMTLGLVSLPGMMTGQILAGASPLDAVKYQIIIMYMIVSSAALTGTITIALMRRLVLNRNLQLLRITD